jgi:HEAT repeat protein
MMSEDLVPIDGPAHAQGETASSDAARSPYKKLFVPLVVVPALIVGVIVLVFLFFGAIRGRDASLSENLDRVISGGAGERTQAAFSMVVQLAENQEAKNSGKPLPWPIEESFLPKLQDAWKKAPADDAKIRLVLATMLAQLGDSEGVPSLIALLDTPPAEDADGFVRFNVLANLGAIGDERALDAIIRVLETSNDEGLRTVACIALQRMKGDKSRAALVGALEDGSFEVRANAALALAARGDPAGASVLRTLLDKSSYTAEHERDSKKFAQGRRVSESRVMALHALSELHRPEDRAAIASVADKDDDLAVREAAMKALADWK